MGANQSTGSNDTETMSFSVDPSGNISYYDKEKEQQERERVRQEKEQQKQQEQQRQQQIELQLQQDRLQQQQQQQQQQVKLSKQNLEQQLQQLQQMKLRRHDSVFNEIEKNLAQCYREKRNCEKLAKEYKQFVDLERNKMLNHKSAINNVPLITTILVIITCVLLHITTVSCYGAMSIDLGSEWMKVGLVAPSVQMDIVLNAASQRKTPMAVAFSNNERFIGDTALDVSSKYPERTFTHFLDLVGKTIEHESVKHYKQRFPYANITSHQPNSTSILLNHPEGLQFTPLELIAMMFQHALDQVTNRMNSNEPANDVVITVPPFFEAKERKVIEEAAKLADLNVLRLTKTNSAFALSYGIFRHKDYLPENSNNKTTILFFDQGASSTSATLADFHLVEEFNEVTGVSKNHSVPTVTIRAEVVDRYLGGFDMQLKLKDYLVRSFSENTNVDENRIHNRGRSASKLLKEAGKIKKILSANTQHTVRVENVIDDLDFKQPITRQEFEHLNEEYLSEKIVQLLDRLYELPDVSRDERLESVIIVGGNTRTPKIQQTLIDYFKLDALGKSINADEGAALAALYQAASLGRGFRVKKFALEEFGDEKKRFDPEKAAAYLATSTQTPPVAPSETTDAPSAAADSVTTTTATSSTTTQTSTETVTQDPNAIYSETELSRIADKLAHLRMQDFLRMQRLSLKNSLESLMSEGKEKLSDNDVLLKDNKEEIEKLIAETNTWLEDAPLEETNNVTILFDKYNNLQLLVRPRPPTPPPPPVFDPSTVDLSSMLNNETLNIFNAIKNFTNPFASKATDDNETSTQQSDATATPEPKPTSSEGGATTTSTTTTPPQAKPEPSKVTPEGPPPHTEL